MRRWCLIGSLLAVVAGNLCAENLLTLTCGLNVVGQAGPFSGFGAVGANGCFSTSFGNITTLDALDWGAPTAASGQSGLGAATAPPVGYNTLAVSVGTPVATRTATVGNDQVGVGLAPGGAATSVTRVDNLGAVYQYGDWVTPGAAGVASFAGHFNSTTTQTPLATGDHLLKDTSGTPLALTFLQPATGVWFRIASLSGNNLGTNSLFAAKVEGYDAAKNLLGTYTLTESGIYGSGGLCSTAWISSTTTPVPCNDAPYVGFYDPLGRISSIYISVFDPGNLNVPIGFAIDALQIEDAPEPAVPLMIGGGLAVLALYRRKRRSQVG